MDKKEILALAKQNGAELVDIKFVDLLGTWQHFTVTLDSMSFDGSDKLPFDGSSIRGFQEIHESDLYLIPDLDTVFVDPYSKKSISVTCDIYDPIKKEFYPRDPRFIAKKAEKHLKESGIADVAYFGPEAEFFVFDSIRYDQNTNSGYYFIDSEEGIWNSGKGGESANLGYKPRAKEGYFPVAPNDTLHELRSDMLLKMRDCGITIEKHHHEVATGGQCELGIKYASLVKSADNTMLYKYLVKNVAREHGKTATFMPKPLFNDNGSGMHVHQSLWKGKTNLFAGNGYGGMSQTALYYIGGLLAHASALAAILSPTTNSYKRLVPGFEAPVNIAYSYRNRSAAVRIPVVEGDAAKRIEYRPPDPSANPYLAFSAMLMAGLDGVRKKTMPGEPFDENIYESKGRKAKQLPGSLAESIEALESDKAFLLQGNVFTPDVLDTYADYKRKKEIDAVRIRPHPWEYHLYYDI